MKRSDKNFIVIVIFLSAGCLITWNLYFRVYRHIDRVNIHLFPKTIGEWHSQEIPITEEEYAILETKNAFTRKYTTAQGKEIYLFIVYSESNRKVSHPPEICYIGNGISVLGHSEENISLGNPALFLKVNKLLLEQGPTQQVTYYWFKVGDSYTSSYWKQQMLIVWKTLLGKPSSSALIRISSTIRQGDQSIAESEMKEFIRSIAAYLIKSLP